MGIVGFSRVLALVAFASCAASVSAEEASAFEVDVPEGASRTLTAAEVSEIGTRTLVKTGAGTLVAGEEMADFAGDIRIQDGFYDATTTNAFGTAAGHTYVNGGTILSRMCGFHSNGKTAYGSESFHLAGTGCQSNGVIRQVSSEYNYYLTRGVITLDDDILVTGGKFEFRSGTVAVNGHNIVVAMDSNGMFRFVALTVKNWGDVLVQSGSFGLEAGIDGGTVEHEVVISSNACLNLSNLQNPQYRRLTFRPGARFHQAYYCTAPAVLGSHNGRNEWRGPIAVEGEERIPMTGESGGRRVIDFSGFVSGPGGFMVKNANWLQLGCETNSFAGGVSAEGIVAPDGWSVTGGVAAVGYGALPPAGGSVDLTNAAFFAYAENTPSNLCLKTSVEYPDVSVHGAGVITSGTSFTSLDLRSLAKTGTGPLTMFGAFHVTGRTDVEGGTLRFGSSVPTSPTGLNWFYGLTYGWDKRKAVPAAVASRGVDASGASFAYREWMPTTGKENNPNHEQSHYYTGWIRVPGEEGEKVKCNFVVSFSRQCYLTIGGQEVVAWNDNKDELTGYLNGQYVRFHVGPQVEVASGWQKFHLYMGNYYNQQVGPQTHTSLGWVANFGVGVDWEGRCVTNSANYVKFLDPGDGSFLRPTMGDYDKAAADPAQWRPTFGGAVAFGPGAVFDVNDAQPYTPVAVPALEGLPTVRNGAVKVASSTWTLRASDFIGADGRARARPLSLEGDASLAFPDGPVELAFSEDDAAELAAVNGKADWPLLTAERDENVPANRFTVPSALYRKNWRVLRDGRTLTLSHVTGLIVVIR